LYLIPELNIHDDEIVSGDVEVDESYFWPKRILSKFNRIKKERFEIFLK